MMQVRFQEINVVMFLALMVTLCLPSVAWPFQDEELMRISDKDNDFRYVVKSEKRDYEPIHVQRRHYCCISPTLCRCTETAVNAEVSRRGANVRRVFQIH